MTAMVRVAGSRRCWTTDDACAAFCCSKPTLAGEDRLPYQRDAARIDKVSVALEDPELMMDRIRQQEEARQHRLAMERCLLGSSPASRRDDSAVSRQQSFLVLAMCLTLSIYLLRTPNRCQIGCVIRDAYASGACRERAALRELEECTFNPEIHDAPDFAGKAPTVIKGSEQYYRRAEYAKVSDNTTGGPPMQDVCGVVAT